MKSDGDLLLARTASRTVCTKRVRLGGRSLILSLLVLTNAGCAVLPYHHPRPSPHARAREDVLLDDAHEDYVGVIHIHTQYSDGAGTYEEIARIANAQRLDYLIVTDHNTLQPLRDGKQGWYGKTLVLTGTEISTQAGHYLALNVTEEIDRSKLNTQQIIDEVNRQGGLGFIAHPYFKRRRWTDWTVHGFTGIEAYNIAHDTLDENRLRLVLWTLAVPPEPFYLSIVDRPYDPLRKWDELLARHQHIVGIGSSDAHEVRVFGMKFAPYDVMFQLIRTHLLIPSETLTDQAIYDALRNGHAYLSMELMTEAKGFTFTANDGQHVLGIMGDDVPLIPNLRLSASLPGAAQLTLFRDGQPVAATTAQVWHMPIMAPGIYRLEASWHDKPWIFSNPIYVHPDANAPEAPAAPNADQPAAARSTSGRHR